MQAIHLSYNKGLNHPTLKDELVARVRARELEEHVVLYPPTKKIGTKQL